MRLITPEISWHETTPIYSCDIQQTLNTDSNGATLVPPSNRRDNRVQLWKLPAAATPIVEFLSSLRRHEKPRLLASGSDDATRAVVGRQEVQPELPLPRQLTRMTSCARRLGLFGGRCELTWRDVYDLGWMPDSMGLVSVSQLNRSIVRWKPGQRAAAHNCTRARPLCPGASPAILGRLVATQSSDRTVRVLRLQARAVVIAKCVRNTEQQQQQQQQSNNYRLFADDSWKSFFRRLSFSPDGKVLAAPAGLHWNDNYCVHLFGRAKLDKPFRVPGYRPVRARCCAFLSAPICAGLSSATGAGQAPEFSAGSWLSCRIDGVFASWCWKSGGAPVRHPASVPHRGAAQPALPGTETMPPVGQTAASWCWLAQTATVPLCASAKANSAAVCRAREGESGRSADSLAPPPPPPPTPQSSTKPPQAPPATPASCCRRRLFRCCRSLTWRPADTAGSEASGAVRDAGASLDAASAGAGPIRRLWNADNSGANDDKCSCRRCTSTVAPRHRRRALPTHVEVRLRKKRRVSFSLSCSCVGNGGGGVVESGSGAASEGRSDML
uniref:WD_REPEATS_REGION domain-containing protein n=1 Tax=Macrostomum lignano TaxID=282301 RepID=A0A1I8FDL8_9PLAT